MNRAEILQPGQTLGIVGGGQLGRMTAREAVRAGYRVAVYTDEAHGSPAGQIADVEINAPYADDEARDRFVEEADVVTMEFENIPAAFLAALDGKRPLYPSGTAVEICQNREREKNFLRRHGLPHADFRVVQDANSLRTAMGELGSPCVLKTADFGYDGKGQQRLAAGADCHVAWQSLGTARGVLEQWIDFRMEISVIGCRSRAGEFAAFPPCENIHRHHILDTTIAPARVEPALANRAVELARAVAHALNYTGTLGVEMFVTASGDLMVNEIAPRPHNSGHHTIDACLTNQFAQHVRCVAGLPPGDPHQHLPAVMVNLLGDLWPEPDQPPDWTPVLNHPRAFLHLYGKRLARHGRKMGHFTVLAPSVDRAVDEAMALRRALGRAD